MQMVTNDGRSQAQALAGTGNCPVFFELPFYFRYWNKNRDCCQHLRNFQLSFPKTRAWPCPGDPAVCGVSKGRHHTEGTKRAFLHRGGFLQPLLLHLFPILSALMLTWKLKIPIFYWKSRVLCYTELNSPSLPPVPHPKSFYFKAPQDSFAIVGPQLQWNPL